MCIAARIYTKQFKIRNMKRENMHTRYKTPWHNWGGGGGGGGVGWRGRGGGDSGEWGVGVHESREKGPNGRIFKVCFSLQKCAYDTSEL